MGDHNNNNIAVLPPAAPSQYNITYATEQVVKDIVMWKDLIYDIHQTTTIWIRMYKMHMGVMKEKFLALCDLAHGGSFYIDSKICYYQDMGDSSYRWSIPFSKLWKHSEVGRTSYYSASRPFHMFTGTLFKIELHLLNIVWFGGFQTYAGDLKSNDNGSTSFSRVLGA